MYKLFIESEKNGQRATDEFNCPTIHAVRSVMQAYEILKEEIINADIRLVKE